MCHALSVLCLFDAGRGRICVETEAPADPHPSPTQQWPGLFHLAATAHLNGWKRLEISGP
jgi:hypothetical protein